MVIIDPADIWRSLLRTLVPPRSQPKPHWLHHHNRSSTDEGSRRQLDPITDHGPKAYPALVTNGDVAARDGTGGDEHVVSDYGVMPNVGTRTDDDIPATGDTRLDDGCLGDHDIRLRHKAAGHDGSAGDPGAELKSHGKGLVAFLPSKAIDTCVSYWHEYQGITWIKQFIAL